MPKRIALAFLALGAPLILATSLWDVEHGEVVFSFVAVAFPIALIALGAERRGTLGPLGRPLVALAVYYEACVGGMLLLRGHVGEGPWLLGLPLATAIQVYGVFVLPLLFVSFLYARTFERFGLRREDLDALRRRFGAGPPSRESGGD